ncbi:hypothetical protein F5Y16DRAFT_396771 [Xylariaceae sp. FL0255]|nr:hypothetical protein F5Y16DRAFT_396771 [Xylariaceae sp. FL0255]
MPSMFSTIGMIMFLVSIAKLVRQLYVYDLLHVFNIYRQTFRLNRYTRTKDGSAPWAFVSNAEAGVGRAFADALAASGFNMVLHSHEAEELGFTLNKLSKKHPGREFRSVITDNCVDGGYLSMLNIVKALEDISLKVFVNNAGPARRDLHPHGSIELFSSFHIGSNINRFATFPTLLIRFLTPYLLMNTPSLILNIDGIEDLTIVPVPGYVACKSYMHRFTLELAREMKALDRQVEVLCHRAGELAGIGHDRFANRGVNLHRPTINTFVAASLARVGCGETVMIPYLWHAVMAWWADLLPERVREALHERLLEDYYRSLK